MAIAYDNEVLWDSYRLTYDGESLSSMRPWSLDVLRQMPPPRLTDEINPPVPRPRLTDPNLTGFV